VGLAASPSSAAGGPKPTGSFEQLKPQKVTPGSTINVKFTSMDPVKDSELWKFTARVLNHQGAGCKKVDATTTSEETVSNGVPIILSFAAGCLPKLDRLVTTTVILSAVTDGGIPARGLTAEWTVCTHPGTKSCQ
jgi:hypothetical protein